MKTCLPSQEDALIDPDEPLALEEMIEETCENDDDDNEFFSSHNNDGDENEIDGGEEDDYEEESSNSRPKVTNPPRRKQFRPGQTVKTYSCSEEGCNKFYTALHHLKVNFEESNA